MQTTGVSHQPRSHDGTASTASFKAIETLQNWKRNNHITTAKYYPSEPLGPRQLRSALREELRSGGPGRDLAIHERCLTSTDPFLEKQVTLQNGSDWRSLLSKAIPTFRYQMLLCQLCLQTKSTVKPWSTTRTPSAYSGNVTIRFTSASNTINSQYRQISQRSISGQFQS